MQNHSVGNLSSKQQHYGGYFEVGKHAAYNQSGQAKSFVKLVYEIGDGENEEELKANLSTSHFHVRIFVFDI